MNAGRKASFGKKSKMKKGAKQAQQDSNKPGYESYRKDRLQVTKLVQYQSYSLCNLKVNVLITW